MEFTLKRAKGVLQIKRKMKDRLSYIKENLVSENNVILLQNTNFSEIAKSIRSGKHKLEIESINFPINLFNDSLAKVDYKKNYPNYYREFGPPNNTECNFISKCYEHFFSFQLANIKKGKTVADIACSNSPVHKILSDFYGCEEVFRQDLQFSQNHPLVIAQVNRLIGGDASNLRVESEKFDALLLHNSWEHFEGESDLKFLFEAERILKKGGIVAIIPLFLSKQTYQVTSPSIWHSKYPTLKYSYPLFDLKHPIVVDDSIEQRMVKYLSVETLSRYSEKVRSLKFKIFYIADYKEYDFIKFPFSLIIQKR